jgi:putative PLP-dependent aminotransferase (TIGR04422 family)
LRGGWFLWPEPRWRRYRGSLTARADAVESLLSSYFPDAGHPVFVSSGRAGLVLALRAMGLERPDTVGLFPYASHCVVEAVGRVASPVSGQAATQQPYRIVYHQWGFVQERTAHRVCVEDAVDSFCLRGTRVFASNADFAIWSLPKLVGSLGGGVLWCRESAAAVGLRQMREQQTGGASLRWALRLASASMPSLAVYWHGAESAGGSSPSWGCADALNVISHWDEIVVARTRRCELMKEFLVPWLSIEEGRLPTVIPVAANADQGADLAGLGFTAGYRHIERLDADGTRRNIRVFPIPVHQDVPLQILERARVLIGNA